MGLFGGCDHRWGKWGRPYDGKKQRRCRKCGRLQVRKVSQAWCNHRWKIDRRHKPPIFKCRKCAKIKPIPKEKLP